MQQRKQSLIRNGLTFSTALCVTLISAGAAAIEPIKGAAPQVTAKPPQLSVPIDPSQQGTQFLIAGQSTRQRQDPWYKVEARLLETNCQPLKDYNGTNVSSVSVAVKAPAPQPDPAPAKVSGAHYDWSGDPQACRTVAGFLSDAWEYMDEVIAAACTGVSISENPGAAADLGKTFRQCADTSREYTEGVSKAVSEYNKLVGNSWATLGPRPKKFNIDAKGTLIFPGDRTFVSAVPSRKDVVNLRIRELAGKAKVEVIVCMKSQRGNVQRLNKSFGFNYRSPSTNNERQDESLLIGGVRDDIVTVVMKTRENPTLAIDVGRKFQYILRATER